MTGPPHLPADNADRHVPQAIRGFVGCTVDEMTLAPGRIGWMGLPGAVRPDVRFVPGPRRGTVDVVVSLVGLGIAEARLTAEVREGRLCLDTSGLPDVVPGLGDVRQSIAAWVQGLDDWLARNEKAIRDLRLRRGGLRVSKVHRIDRPTKPTRTTRPAGPTGCRLPPGSLVAAVLATSRRALRRPSGW